jgi:hypothetical protein
VERSLTSAVPEVYKTWQDISTPLIVLHGIATALHLPIKT